MTAREGVQTPAGEETVRDACHVEGAGFVGDVVEHDVVLVAEDVVKAAPSAPNACTGHTLKRGRVEDLPDDLTVSDSCEVGAGCRLCDDIDRNDPVGEAVGVRGVVEPVDADLRSDSVRPNSQRPEEVRAVRGGDRRAGERSSFEMQRLRRAGAGLLDGDGDAG